MGQNDTPSYLAPPAGYQSRKAAQISAFFAVKSDGMIEKLKLIKLIYIAEREYLFENRMAMLFDELYSLPHGPICSSTLNGIDGRIDDDIWSDFIAKNGNIVVATKSFKREDLDELNDVEFDLLGDVWNRFGDMTASQIRNWSHENCPEYTEITSGRIPISYKSLMDALGDPESANVDQEISDFRRAAGMLSA
jgi:uncharacterized phage-associated protein